MPGKKVLANQGARSPVVAAISSDPLCITNTPQLAHIWAYRGYPGRSEVAFELLVDGNKPDFTHTGTGLKTFPLMSILPGNDLSGAGVALAIT